MEFTTNESVPLPHQIDLFNQFDIVLGSHGSQWALAWFAERPQAIVEMSGTSVGGAKRNRLFLSLGHQYAHTFCMGVNEQLQEEAGKHLTPKTLNPEP